MHSTLLKTIIFLTFSLLTNADLQRIPGAWQLGSVDDWVFHRNYRIYSCGSQALEVENLLDFTYLWLQNAILSTETPAYKAFFRGNDPAPIIKVLDAIVAGSNITDPEGRSEQPTLVCANQADDGIRKFWNFCENFPETLIVNEPSSSIYFLCPWFFNFALAPQPDNCGIVNHANTGLIADKYLYGTRYGFFVWSMAKNYIRETMDREPLSESMTEENACLALPPDQSVINPMSYTFFTANILARCTRFPQRVSIQRDRELIEVDGVDGSNGTQFVALGCNNSGGNSSSCSG